MTTPTGTLFTGPPVVQSRQNIELCHEVRCEGSVDKSVSRMEYCSV